MWLVEKTKYNSFLINALHSYLATLNIYIVACELQKKYLGLALKMKAQRVIFELFLIPKQINLLWVIFEKKV